MAVTPTTLVELNDLAKDLYTNFYQPQMALKTPLKAQFDQLENFQFAGRKAIFGLKLETGGGAANAGANKTLPDNADGTYDQGETTLARTYVRLAIDAFLMEITKQQSGSYRPALQEKMEDRMTAINKEINRQLFGAGDGKLARTDTAGAGTTQTLSLAYNVTNGGNPGRNIFKGDVLAFYQSNGTLIGRHKVTGKTATVGSATVDVELATTVTSTTDGFVSKSTANDDNFTSGENKGLLSAMVQSGTFQAVPIASTYSALSMANGGVLQDISDPLVATLVNGIYAQCDEWVNLIVTRAGIVQKYSEIFLPIRRINGQDVQLKGGYKPMAVYQHGGGDSPILTDNDCPGARLFGLNTKYIRSIDLIGQQWATFDGAQFTRVTDQDGAEGYIRKYWQTVWTRLNCHGVLADLKDVAQLDRIYS